MGDLRSPIAAYTDSLRRVLEKLPIRALLFQFLLSGTSAALMDVVGGQCGWGRMGLAQGYGWEIGISLFALSVSCQRLPWNEQVGHHMQPEQRSDPGADPCFALPWLGSLFYPPEHPLNSLTGGD